VGLPFGAGGEGGGEGEGEQFGSISVSRAWFDRVASRLLSIEVGEGCLGVGSLLLTFASPRSSPLPLSGSLSPTGKRFASHLLVRREVALRSRCSSWQRASCSVSFYAPATSCSVVSSLLLDHRRCSSLKSGD